MENLTKYHQLSEFKILKNLTEQELHQLAASSRLNSKSKGDYIFLENDDKKFVYLLTEGSIKLGSNISDEKILIKNIVYKHSLLGENIFSGTTKRTEFAQAIKDIQYYEIPLLSFQNLVIKNSKFADDILALIVDRLQKLEKRVENFVFLSAKSRILGFIKNSGLQHGIKIGMDECLINHGMSHKEIAYLTDTSRQTVARVLSELKKDKLIHFSPRKPNKILIRNIANLAS